MNFRSLLRVVLAASPALSAGVVPCAGAQDFQDDSTGTARSSVIARSNPTTRSTPTTRPWVTKGDAVGGSLAVLATLVIAPLDSRTARELQERHVQAIDDLQQTARQFAFFGGPGPFVIGAGLYAAGRLTRIPRLANAGLHVTEAVLLAASVNGLGKGIFGRALPNVDMNNPDDFQFFRGFHEGNGPFVSFPSGHAAASFAMAAVLTDEADRWHPGMARFVGPIVYGAAGLVGVARMYQNVHWASDLPIAAAIGTWSGLTVVARSHRKADQSNTQTGDVPGELVQVLRSTTLVPAAAAGAGRRGGHGAGLAWTIPLELGSRSHGQ